ncbi:MAG TPA: hypothetical protein VK964_02390 [Nocardioidaceae bacterium]|nr:hypothetical protein [Nocardioidaceae bacterium]
MRWSHRGASLLLLGVLAACGDDPGDTAEPARAQPSLGAPAPSSATPPAEPMDHVEEPVAARLAPSLEEEDLTLEYVDCPRWDGVLPANLACKGYVDGVVGEVDVELAKGRKGHVEFDAWLDQGVVATARLVRRLEDEGYADVDCGRRPAYPAEPGLRIVCRGHAEGEVEHVVATVVDHDGSVRIEDY